MMIKVSTLLQLIDDTELDLDELMVQINGESDYREIESLEIKGEQIILHVTHLPSGKVGSNG